MTKALPPSDVPGPDAPRPNGSLSKAPEKGAAPAAAAAKADDDVEAAAGTMLTAGETPAPIKAAAVSKPATGGDNADSVRGMGQTCIIACKHPSGIIMQLQASQKFVEPVLGGGIREETRYVGAGKQYVCHGPARMPQDPMKCDIVAGFALTTGIPAAFAREWFEQNKASMLVESGLMFMAKNDAEARARAREYRALQSGLQQIDTGTKSENGREVPRDPRWVKPPQPGNLTSIQTDGTGLATEGM